MRLARKAWAKRVAQGRGEESALDEGADA